ALYGHPAAVIFHSLIGYHTPRFDWKSDLYRIAVFPGPLQRDVARWIHCSRRGFAVDLQADLGGAALQIRVQTSGSGTIPRPAGHAQPDDSANLVLCRHTDFGSAAPGHFTGHRKRELLSLDLEGSVTGNVKVDVNGVVPVLCVEVARHL